jgi:tRNA (guanine-N7-)-methyltransferase
MAEELNEEGDSNIPIEEGKAPQKRSHDNDDTSEPSNKLLKLPQKRNYRQRAHVNPLSFNSFDNHYHPTGPDNMKWEDFFGPSFNGKTREDVKNLDIGCGYGGLLFKLSSAFPGEFSTGMEIREKVSRFVKDKITAMRHNEPGKWENICCFRTNTMQYLQNFIAKAQLERIFVLFPDPHFKKKKIKWRIISIPLISQYAYFMKTGGIFYTVTDVLDYHEWILENFSASKFFTKVDDEELKDDPIFPEIFNSSEEGQKVTRNDGPKYHAIYRRTDIESPYRPNEKKDENEKDDESDNEKEDEKEEESLNSPK